MTESNGILIVVDGIDGAGKTTQVELIASALQNAGESVVCSKEPTDGVWGRKLRESARTGRMTLEDELHAFTEDRREHVETLIRPAMQRGDIVLLDRYFYSTIAYQGARGADPAAIEATMRAFAPQPDAAVFIDLPPATAIARISGSRGDVPNQFERADYLSGVREIFADIAKRDRAVTVIDGTRDIDTVFETIVRFLVQGVLKAKRCAKSYDCDADFCSFRMAGTCKWAELRKRLTASAALAAT